MIWEINEPDPKKQQGEIEGNRALRGSALAGPDEVAPALTRARVGVADEDGIHCCAVRGDCAVPFSH